MTTPVNRYCDIWDGSFNGSGTYRLDPSTLFYGDDDGTNNHERCFMEFDYPAGYQLDDPVFLDFNPGQGTAFTIYWYFTFPTNVSQTQQSPPGTSLAFVLGAGQQQIDISSLVADATMSGASKIVLGFQVTNFSDVTKSIDPTVLQLTDGPIVGDVKIWASGDTVTNLFARREDGDGPIYYGENNGIQSFITVPGNADYIVTGQRKTAGIVDRIGSRVVSVQQADVSAFFQTPAGSSITLTIDTDPDVEYQIAPIDAFGYLATIISGTADGNGDASESVPAAAELGLSSVHYRVTARKRNDVDASVFDWVRHAIVEVTDSNATVQIGAS